MRCIYIMMDENKENTMRFEWNNATIEYYARAAGYTDFFGKLSEFVVPLLRKDDSVVDMGCGPGLIDMEIARHAGRVRSVDISESALAYLKGESARRGIKNIETVICDASDFSDTNYDVLIMTFFGTKGDNKERLISSARRAAVIITHGMDTGTKGSLIGSGTNESSPLPMREFLEDSSYAYTELELELEFGQPFMSREDAVRYFELYLKEEDPVKRREIIEKRVANLTPARPPYTLYHAKTRSVSVFTIKTE